MPSLTTAPVWITAAADALVETLSAIARRQHAHQHQHCERTTRRLSAVLASELLPDDLVELATYCLAKAQRDLGLTDDSHRGMQRVASADGRLASAARRGLAHLSRLSGDFPHLLRRHRPLLGRPSASRVHRASTVDRRRTTENNRPANHGATWLPTCRNHLATTRQAFHTCADRWSTRHDYDRRSWTGWSVPRS